MTFFLLSFKFNKINFTKFVFAKYSKLGTYKHKIFTSPN
ncbi:MAG: hypothetical protein JWP67_200 [Mucilaginibacter sp.]|nr:hypothetical protein [Mucilaginibacter sp.]MDB5286931.1 hypothetical protein [Mucilaginibacter sp.]